MSEVISFRVDDKIKREISTLTNLWHLKKRELARKVFLDGLAEFKDFSIELALRKVAEGKLEPIEAAEMLNMDLENFEEIAVKRGIVEGITVEDIKNEFKKLERLGGG